MGPILFLYREESLVSSNLNSKQLRFHGAHPNLHIDSYLVGEVAEINKFKNHKVYLSISKEV